jgi:hypothetical protein
MTKLLALLSASALLLLAPGCGDTCSTAPTEVQPTHGCNVGVAAGATITVSARPACQSCAQSSPSCDISETSVANEVFLDVKVKECDSDKGCGSASCSFGNVSCSYSISPVASGPIKINYRIGSSTDFETLTVGGGSATSCTL